MTIHSRKNDVSFLLPTRGIHSTKYKLLLFPKFRKCATLMDIPLTFLAHFRLLHINGLPQDALQWCRAIRTKSPVRLKYPAWEFVTIYAITKHMTWGTYNQLLCRPSNTCALVDTLFFSSFVTTVARHDHAYFMHGPRNKIILYY